MSIDRLLIGLLDTSSEIDDSIVADKYRDLTISWSRYGYHDAIVQADTVDEILARALDEGYRYCLIQAYGHIIQERWNPGSDDFFASLASKIDQRDFLVMGKLISDEDWHGIEGGCALINLETYRRLNTPRFATSADRVLELPGSEAVVREGRTVMLRPASPTRCQRPRHWGWPFIYTSLVSDLPVLGFDEDLAARSLYLNSSDRRHERAFARYLGEAIQLYRRDQSHDDLSTDQVEFLDAVSCQTNQARNGVFLWNIESYADIEASSQDFPGPVSSLYSVAAGFKPNRILATHGFNNETRVVYFDYSPNALAVKQYIVEQWDGDDFPSFIQQLFNRFPSPETYYQLWNDLTPDAVDRKDIERQWQEEIERWGGESMFRDHWRAYRTLSHEYVCCDLLTDAQPLLDRVTDEERAVIWWSNAFFTMYGNWFYSLDQRQSAYEAWLESLASINPRMHCFGSDYNNSNVNRIQAGECWDRYRHLDVNSLTPCRLGATEVRM